MPITIALKKSGDCDRLDSSLPLQSRRKNLRNLKYLFLNNNQLSHLSDELYYLKLKQLDIYDNPLSVYEIPDLSHCWIAKDKTQVNEIKKLEGKIERWESTVL